MNAILGLTGLAFADRNDPKQCDYSAKRRWRNLSPPSTDQIRFSGKIEAGVGIESLPFRSKDVPGQTTVIVATGPSKRAGAADR